MTFFASGDAVDPTVGGFGSLGPAIGPVGAVGNDANPGRVAASPQAGIFVEVPPGNGTRNWKVVPLTQSTDVPRQITIQNIGLPPVWVTANPAYVGPASGPPGGVRLASGDVYQVNTRNALYGTAWYFQPALLDSPPTSANVGRLSVTIAD